MPEVASIDVAALGHPVRIDVVDDDPAQMLEEIGKAWHLCLDVPEGPRSTVLVDLLSYEGLTCPSALEYDALVSSRELGAAMQQLTQSVTRLGIDARAGETLMMHAAGLANPDTGAAVALVAPGGTGKTTACRTLGPRWSYLTDETVAVGPDDVVIPYPKPLSIRTPDSHHKAETAPGDLGLTVCEVPATLKALVVMLRKADWGDQPEVTVLNPLDAMVAIAPETSSLAQLPQPLHYLRDLFGRLDLVARVTYQEVETLAPLIADLIGPPRRVG